MLLLSCVAPAPALAEAVCAAKDWQNARFRGEAHGGYPAQAQAGPYVVTLTPVSHGWEIGVREAGGEAIPVLALPLRPVETNPVFIAGWHFRNQDNTGPNTGDVNAPQAIRSFTFGALAVEAFANPDLLGPAPGVAPPPAPEGSGHGQLMIENYGLADLSPGERARMVYMKFSGCLEWNAGPDLMQTAETGVALQEAASIMENCGLPAAVYRLSDRMAGGREGRQTPYLTPDMDGDGADDFVAAIERLSDGAPGLAVCLAGSRRLVLAGYDGRIGRHLEPGYFGRVDWWTIHSGAVFQSGAEGPPPVLRGDAILIGKDDSSSALMYLDADLRPASYWQGD